MSGMSGFWASVLKGLISLIGLIVLIFLALGILPWLRRQLAPDPKREHTIKLRNLSNFPCAFVIEFGSEHNNLQAGIYFKGSPLPKASASITTIQHSEPSPAKPEGKQVRPIRSTPDVSKAKGKLTILSPIISILGSIGGLIPGSVGASMKEASNNMRQSQMDARIALDAPEMAKKRVDAISSQGAKVVGKENNHSKVATSSNVDHDRAKSTEELPEPSPVRPIIEELSDRYITKTIPEGEILDLDLRLRWDKFEHTAFSKVYHLWVSQRPVDERVAVDGEPVDHEGFVTFPAGRLWGYVLARASQIIFALLLVAAQAALMVWVWVV